MRWISAVVLLVFYGVSLAQGQISARLSRDTIYSGETVTLIIESSGNPRGLEPDYSVLERGFYLGDTTTSSQLSVVQGRRELTTQWAIELEPRTEGEIVVPPIPVGQTSTQPMRLNVLPRAQARDGAEEIFLEMDVSSGNPYVNSQVLLTIRLYHKNALTEGRLVEPALPNAVVERLGEDVADSAVIKGTRYRVLVRRFAMFPEKSGTMTIPPARFRGRVADSQSGFNSIFDRGRRVSVASDPLELEVRPRPSGYSGEWLPAANLEIDEEWPNDGTEFVVGEPTTRRLTLKAKGLLAVQLPEIELPGLDGVKVYPDKARSQSRTDGTWVYGEREQGYAFVPTRPGKVRLPEIRIPWWDTVNDRYLEAVVPAREIIVQPGALAKVQNSWPIAGSDVPTAGASGQAGYWRWVALGALVLWFATLVSWRLERRRKGLAGDRTAGAVERESATTKQWRSRLKTAAESGDAQRTAEALMGWASSARGEPVRSLGAAERMTSDPEARELIRALDETLYRDPAPDWDGRPILAHAGKDLFSPERADHVAPERPLEPLYPEA